MLIGKPRVVEGSGVTRVSAPVDYARGQRELWYQVETDFRHLLDTRTLDAFLVGLCIVAMRQGEDIRVEHPVSARLLYNITQSFQFVARSTIPDLRSVRIFGDTVSEFDNQGAGVATGFSAGVDSFTVVADHFLEADRTRVPSEFRLTHLLFNDVGSSASGDVRLNDLRREADSLGLPLVRVKSNLREFYRGERLQYVRTHNTRNVSAAMVLQNGLGRFLYASAHPYRDIHVGPTEACSYNDPVSLPLLSTERFQPISSGSRYSRVEKTRRIASLLPVQRALNVCVDPVEGLRNCSRCAKCLRTQVTLEIDGSLESFAGVFDLAVYQRHRVRYMAEILADDDPFNRDIRRFTRSRGFRFPSRAYAFAFWRRVRRALGRVKLALARALRSPRDAQT